MIRTLNNRLHILPLFSAAVCTGDFCANSVNSVRSSSTTFSREPYVGPRCEALTK